MNRKLQHSLKALSATAAVFTVLLFAGGPVTGPVSLAVPQTGSTSADLLEATIDASDLPQSTASQRRHLRHSREVLALPYFSFAQGLRRNRS